MPGLEAEKVNKDVQCFASRIDPSFSPLNAGFGGAQASISQTLKLESGQAYVLDFFAAERVMEQVGSIKEYYFSINGLYFSHSWPQLQIDSS